MKFLVVLVASILAASAVTDQEQWLQFKQTHGREYRNIREEQRRFAIFQDSLRTIEAHNEKYAKGEVSYYFGVTPFADLTPAEFLSMFNTTKPSLNVQRQSMGNVQAPSSIDWRDRGVVSEVKNQGSCGSCWSFSATGAMEAAYSIKTGGHISLSEQNLVDCTTTYGNNGCRGGTIHAAFRYVMDNGIETEADYSYRAADESCSYSSSLSALRLSNYVALNYDDENDLMQAVGSVGPVSVSIEANNNWQYYAGGVYDDSTCTWNVNHGVLVVGYGEESGTPYWIVKNSWGAAWGDHGYIKMARNKNDQCGIALYAVYPVL